MALVAHQGWICAMLCRAAPDHAAGSGYGDVLQEVDTFFSQRLEQINQAGVKTNRLFWMLLDSVNSGYNLALLKSST